MTESDSSFVHSFLPFSFNDEQIVEYGRSVRLCKPVVLVGESVRNDIGVKCLVLKLRVPSMQWEGFDMELLLVSVLKLIFLEYRDLKGMVSY